MELPLEEITNDHTEVQIGFRQYSREKVLQEIQSIGVIVQEIRD